MGSLNCSIVSIVSMTIIILSSISRPQIFVFVVVAIMVEVVILVGVVAVLLLLLLLLLIVVVVDVVVIVVVIQFYISVVQEQVAPSVGSSKSILIQVL